MRRRLSDSWWIGFAFVFGFGSFERNYKSVERAGEAEPCEFLVQARTAHAVSLLLFQVVQGEAQRCGRGLELSFGPAGALQGFLEGLRGRLRHSPVWGLFLYLSSTLTVPFLFVKRYFVPVMYLTSTRLNRSMYLSCTRGVPDGPSLATGVLGFEERVRIRTHSRIGGCRFYVPQCGHV